METAYEILYKEQNTNRLESFKVREEARKLYSFGVLTEEAIKQLKPYAPFIEVGSGNGYWAYEMTRRGVKVIATDLVKIDTNIYKFTKAWTIVRRMTATQAVSKFPKYTLLMVWPCYDKPWAYEALKAYKGDTFVYCGEGYGGCNADDDFHQLLHDEWEEVEHIPIPRWYGLHDYLLVYKRK
jgi:hypothetical protein